MLQLQIRIILCLCISLIVVERCTGITSPLRPLRAYEHSVVLQANVADLWWTVNDTKQEITFELHMKTTGWIAFGISPAGGMKGADIAVGWVDSSGKVYLQDRFAVDNVKPVLDNTTQDWFVLHGREQDGWTAIQFKRYFDTCDPMDVPIKSGTNIMIFAYGLVDLDLCQSNVDIQYHDDRRGTRILPLRSYVDQPAEELLAGLDFIDFRFDNHPVPSADTTYYCKIFKSPSRFLSKKHAIAHEVLIDPRNGPLLHHLDLFECTSRDVIDDSKLIDGICDEVLTGTRMCSSKIATSWAIGADPRTMYPEEAGYPVTSDTGSKYFMIKIHYDNPRMASNLRDSSGIRFYLANELRKYDLGYVLFGVSSRPTSIAIPPKAEQFIVDTYCPPEASQDLPSSGVTVVSALPHTHLQGYSVWTKLIRNNKAVQYLFNAEAFNFNYQFANRLPKSIKIYPGDAFVTRCIYRTLDKNEVTLGGERTADEMCSHTFSYYPFIGSFSACVSSIGATAWQTIMNTSSSINNTDVMQWLHNQTWTPESTARLQEFFGKAPRQLLLDKGDQMVATISPTMPEYEDIKVEPCTKRDVQNNIDPRCGKSNNSAVSSQYALFTFALVLFLFGEQI